MSSIEQQLYISGQWVSAEGGATYDVCNPFTGGIATRATTATVGRFLLLCTGKSRFYAGA